MNRIISVSVASVAALALVFSAGCKKNSSDPGEAIMGHMKTIFKLMKDNKDDCDKMLKEVTSYTESNKTDLQESVKKLAEMEKKLSDEEKKKYEEKMEKMSEDMMKESMAVMMEVAQKCPAQMQEVGKAMSFMDKIK